MQIILDEMNQGFGIVRDQFSQMDKHFKKIDQRFEKIDKRFDKVDQRFDIMDFQIKDLRHDMNNRFSATDKKINDLTGHIDGLIQLSKTHDCEIAALQHVFERHESILEKL